MNLDGQIFIACTNCSKAKAKCDKKTPCTRCVTKQLTCEPRPARRSLNALAQRQTSQLRALEPQAVRTFSSNGDDRRPAPTGAMFDGGHKVRPAVSQKSPFSLQTPAQTPIQHTEMSLSNQITMANSQRMAQTTSPARTSPISATASMQWHISPESESQPEEGSTISNNRMEDPRTVESDHSNPNPPDYGYLNIDDPNAMMDLDMTDIMNPMFSDLGFPGQHITPFDTLLGSWADYPSYLYNTTEAELDYYPQSSVEPVRPPRPNNQPSQVAVQDHAVIIAAQEAWPLFRCNPRTTTTTHYPSTAGIHLQGLENTLTSEFSWTAAYDAQVDPTPSRRIAIEPIQNQSRDKLLAVTQILFHNARSLRDDSVHDAVHLESGTSGLCPTPFIILPPPNIMDNFIRTYGNCFDSFYRLASGTALKPSEVMLHNDSKISTVLILLMVAFGAMLVPTMGARHIASGLIEVCRIALGNVLERDVTLSSDPTLSHSALLYLTLGIWSGDKWQMDLAMGQRGMYIYMLRHVEVPRPIPGDQSSPEVLWKYWREQESQNRLKYAWVMADQEWSLFLDTTAMISINTLQEPMPSHERLWKADSAAEWTHLMKETQGADSSSFPMSLRDLYRSFMDGEVLKSRQQLSPIHLRLLLHPLQGLVCHLRQCLQCFSDYGSNRAGSRALSQTATQAQLNQVHQVLQQWYTLSSRCSPSETTCSPIFFSSLIIYHLISLNTMISFTDLEEVAARGPSKVYSHFDRRRSPTGSSPWHDICPSQESEEIFFHCGQLMRLFCIVPQSLQAIWWPAILYRVALTAWFTSMATQSPSPSSPWDSSQSGHQSNHSGSQSYMRGPTHSSSSGPEDTDSAFAIDALPPDDATLVRYVKFREGEPMFSRPGGGYVSLRDPLGILRHCVCIINLGGVTSRLREGVRNKLELLAERWGS